MLLFRHDEMQNNRSNGVNEIIINYLPWHSLRETFAKMVECNRYPHNSVLRIVVTVTQQHHLEYENSRSAYLSYNFANLQEYE